MNAKLGDYLPCYEDYWEDQSETVAYATLAHSEKQAHYLSWLAGRATGMRIALDVLQGQYNDASDEKIKHAAMGLANDA